MASDTLPAAARARMMMLAAVASILFPTMAMGATRNVDAANRACSDTTGTPFCKVQAAIDASSPGDRIEIAAGSYIESLTIDRNLTLHGAGISTVEGSCNGQTNLLGAPAVTVQAGVIVLLTDVTIKGGTADLGGGINNAGILFLASSEVCQNQAFNQGAGIYNSGSISLNRVQLYDNQQANAGVTGGGLHVASGRALVRHSTFSNNRVARGGGISVADGATLVLSRSTLTSNFADGTIASVVSSRGGGIDNSGTAIIDQTDIGEGNAVIATGALGGGIFNEGFLLMSRSVLRVNATDHVAGQPNAVGFGAGLYNTGLATISSSTVSGNIINPITLGFGAGIWTSGSLSLSNVTITANTNGGAGVAGGAGVYIDGTGSARIRNSIIAAQAVGDDCGSGVTTDGYNIDSDGTCDLVAVTAGGTDQPNTVAGLLPLADNGGPTRTHALADTSPAIDSGNPAGCKADPNGVGSAQVPLRADQRGSTFVEIPGTGGDPSGCDIGAFEFQPAP